MTFYPSVVPLQVIVPKEVKLSVEDNFPIELDVDVAFNNKATSYLGPTSFIPTEERQIAHTAGQLIEQDIIVEPIPSNYGKITWDGRRITIT